MFRMKLGFVGLAVAALIGGLPGVALARSHDSGGLSLITDTLAPGGATSAQRYSFITDTLAPGGGRSEVFAAAGSGFSWADAGIGACAVVGLGIALVGSGRLLRRRSVVAV